MKGTHRAVSSNDFSRYARSGKDCRRINAMFPFVLQLTSRARTWRVIFRQCIFQRTAFSYQSFQKDLFRQVK